MRRVKPYLTTPDVGRIWGEERDPGDPRAGQPIAARTVYSMVWHATNEAGRYADYPLPVLPVYPRDDLPPLGQHAEWWPPEGKTLQDLERDLRHWWRNRPPAGSGVPRGPKSSYADDVVALVRERAEAGAFDREIADELAERYGTTPAGKPFEPRVVEGIRRRHGIAAGAKHRRGDAND